MEGSHRFITNSIHAGESETSSSTPIYLGATTDARYLRMGNPTLDAFEEKVRVLEGGATAVSTASGMAAVSQTLLALLRPGDRLVCNETVYYWSTELIRVTLPQFGIEVVPVDFTDLDALEVALQTQTTVVYFEPLVNPTCKIADTLGVIERGKAAGATVVIDNTFLSPALLNPLAHGADVVLHSATKFLSGHGDALAGVVVTKDEELGEKIILSRSTFGGILSPLNGYLLLRGTKTLSMRIDRHCVNAQAVAEYLEANRNIVNVQYPGLPSAQGHAIAKSQWRGFGAMLNFEFKESAAYDRFFERIKLIKPWVSLGDAGTLAVGGIHFGGEKNVRMAVGLEDLDDILEDLEHALA